MKYAAPGIQMRRKRYYGIKEIPKDVQRKIGKSRFVQSLGTEHLATAKRRYAVLKIQWEAEIAEARDQPPEDDAVWLRRALERAKKPEERQRVMRTIELASEVPVTLSHAPGVEPVNRASLMPASRHRTRCRTVR
jgi:hypothetical protein